MRCNLSSNVQVAILVVLYRQTPTQSVAFRRAFHEVCKRRNFHLIVFDNSPIPADMRQFPEVQYIHDSSNPGLAQAYNSTLHLCQQQNYSWLILLDQDTKIPEAYFSKVVELVSSRSQKVTVLVPDVYVEKVHLSPFFIESALFLPNKHRGVATFAAINSGMALNVKRLTQSQIHFSTDFPLDFLDYQFFWEIAQKHEAIDKINVVLQQALSVANYQTMSYSRFKSFAEAENRFVRTYYSDKYMSYKFKVWLRVIKMLAMRTQFNKVLYQLKVAAKGK